MKPPPIQTDTTKGSPRDADEPQPGQVVVDEEPADEGPPRHMPLNERYVFETFVVGEGNRFAYAAAQAVSQSPGRTQFNPLVVHGGVGLGKTHLLQAIGHHLLAAESGQRVVYVTAEKFLSDFIESLRQQKTSDFQRLYRSVSVLLVDDIQFLIRSEGTQNEFFHTFNTLHQNGRQIVMTCDNPPGELEGLEERLISRFKGGLVTSIEPPDLETRIAILQKKAEINGIDLPEEVANFPRELYQLEYPGSRGRPESYDGLLRRKSGRTERRCCSQGRTATEYRRRLPSIDQGDSAKGCRSF